MGMSRGKDGEEMNKIIAVLKNIISVENLNLLEFEKEGIIIKVLILQMNVNLKIGDKVYLGIKPTKLFISAKKCEFENVLEVKIKNIQKGKILSNVLCDFYGDEIEAIMLKDYIDFEKKAYLLFKASDISILGKVNES